MLAVAFAVVVSLAACYISFLWLSHKKTLSKLPNPYDGRFGSVFSSDFSQIPYRAHGISKCLGQGIFTINIFNQYFVFISDAEILKKVFLENGSHTSGRKFLPKFSWASKFNGGFFSTDSQANWAHIRKLALSSLREFGYGKSELELRIIEEAQHCCDSMLEISNGKSAVDPFQFLSMVTMNIISSLSYGFTFKHDDDIFLNLLKDTECILEFGLQPNYRQFLPFEFMQDLPFIRNESISKSQAAYTRLLNFAVDEIEKRKCRECDSKDDLLSIFLEASDADGKKMTNVLISVIFAELIIAGAETTSTTLSWLIKLLANDPDLQDRVYNDLKRLNPRTLSLNDVTTRDLHFVNAVIHEALRFGSTIPFIPPHRVTRGFGLRHEGSDWFFPQNATIFGNTWSINRSPDIWRDPLNFNPWNFLDPDTGSFSRPDSFLPFGVGPRTCMGEKLARSELFIILALLIINCKFEKKENEVWDLNAACGIITRKPTPYKVYVTPR